MVFGKKTDNLDELKTKLQSTIQDTDNPELNELLKELLEILESQETENELLVQLLIQMKKDKFGKKAEGVSANQLKLFKELQDIAQKEPVQIKKKQPKKPVNGGGRKPLPDHLPREEVVIEVDESDRHCADCGEEKTVIGHESSECLEYVPAVLKVIVYKREKRVCKPCETGMVVAPSADKLIEKGLPGHGLLTEILVCKFKDHLPLYRLERRFERLGYKIPRSSLSDWIQVTVETYLKPLGARLKALTLKSTILQTDDTPLRVLDRNHPKNIKQGYYWYYLGDHQYVCVDYTPNRKRAGPGTFLGDRVEGYIQSDGYKGYDHIFKEKPDLIRVGCWMHCRRYFVKALDAGDERADTVVSLIKQLYKIEEACKDLDAEALGKIRLKESKPLLDSIKKWCLDNLGEIRPKSLVGRAIQYALNHWPSLIVFAQDGKVPIDNGATERAIRPVAVGRKNYLFAGSDRGARNAAVIYSLMESCSLADVNPALYFKDILQKLSADWSNSRIDELLPHNWKLLHLPKLDNPQENS